MKIENKNIIFEILIFLKERFAIQSNDLDNAIQILKKDKNDKTLTKTDKSNIDDIFKGIFPIKLDKKIEEMKKHYDIKEEVYNNYHSEKKNKLKINIFNNDLISDSFNLEEEINKVNFIMTKLSNENQSTILLNVENKNQKNIGFGNTIQSSVLNEENKNLENNLSINLDLTYNSVYNNYSNFLKSKNEFQSSDVNKSFGSFNKMNKNFNCEKNKFDYFHKEFFSYKISENLDVILSQGVLNFQFNEIKPFYFRKLLFDQILELFFLIPKLFDIKFSDLKTDSWFTMLWNPYKTSNNLFNNTSFISLLNLENVTSKEPDNDEINTHSEEKMNAIKFVQEAILPIKLQKEIFLETIGKFYNNFN